MEKRKLKGIQGKSDAINQFSSKAYPEFTFRWRERDESDSLAIIKQVAQKFLFIYKGKRYRFSWAMHLSIFIV